MMYDKLCTEYYDADKKFAQQDELKLYQEEFNKIFNEIGKKGAFIMQQDLIDFESELIVVML